MANVTKTQIKLTITYQKSNPDNLIWQARAECETPDDREDSGTAKFAVATDQQIITRAAFRALTGQQIEANVVSALDAKIQSMGSGAGSHVINDDYGN